MCVCVFFFDVAKNIAASDWDIDSPGMENYGVSLFKPSTSKSSISTPDKTEVEMTLTV